MKNFPILLPWSVLGPDRRERQVRQKGKSALSGWHCPAVIYHPALAVKNSQELFVVIPGWLVGIKVSRKLIVGLRMMKAILSKGFFWLLITQIEKAGYLDVSTTYKKPVNKSSLIHKMFPRIDVTRVGRTLQTSVE